MKKGMVYLYAFDSGGNPSIGFFLDYNSVKHCTLWYPCRCWSVDFNSVDTKLLASGSDDARVKLWSANINHSVASLEAKVSME